MGVHLSYEIMNECFCLYLKVSSYTNLLCYIPFLRALCCVLLTKYHSGDQVENAEIGRTCGTYGGEERCIRGFSGENLKEGDSLEDPGVDGKTILKWIF
jgi:hypothetical protein